MSFRCAATTCFPIGTSYFPPGITARNFDLEIPLFEYDFENGAAPVSSHPHRSTKNARNRLQAFFHSTQENKKQKIICAS
jgi:hypothetical protein